MTIRHQRRGAGLALRGGGLFLLGGAWLAGRLFSALVASHASNAVTLPTLLVGMAMFASGSMGSALLLLGPRLFDRVVVSERWMTRSPPRP